MLESTNYSPTANMDDDKPWILQRSIVDKILLKIHEAGQQGMTHRDMCQKVRGFIGLSTAEKTKIFEQITNSGEVAVISPSGTKRLFRYVAAQFAQSGENHA